MAMALKNIAVLWDMDGVLVDTTELHFQTWWTALDEKGFPFTREEFLATFGRNSHSAVATVYGDKISPELADEIIDRKENLFQRMAPGRVSLLPDVQTWLTYFKTGGARQAVASSAPMKNIDILVDALDIRNFFDATVSGFKLPTKPNPDVFLKAAEMVGVPPARCVVIEDVAHGVEGAHAAGMKCIAVTTTQTAETLREADLLLEDLRGLDEQRFLALVG